MELELHQIELRHADLRIRDDARRRRLIASIAELGQQTAVIVVADAEADRFVLIDGYQRVEALRRLGRDTVVATAWPLSEVEALLEHHHLSSSSRSALEEAWLLSRLCEQGLGQDEVARRLCRSRSWVSRRLALLSALGERAQARVREGTIPAQAAMKSLVPLARANRRACDALVESLGGARISVRQVAALYEGWRRADATGRQRIVDEPRLYLRALEASETEPASAADASGALGKDLSALAAVAWRARRRALAGGLGGSARRALVGAWRAADGAIVALRAVLEEALFDAGPEHTSDDSPTA